MTRFFRRASSAIVSAATLLILLSICDSAEATVSSSYDFIIVGGGTAGLAVASRIAQGLPRKSVLVLEAGPDAPDENKINIPGMKGSTLGTVYDWNFTTVVQPNAGGRKLNQNRGKVLGGSSALNLMSYDRSSAYEYDVWGYLGNPGWSWNSMIAAMKKAETFFPSSNYGTTGVGSTGPIQTLINRFVPAHQSFWIPVMQALGIQNNLESLGGNPLGVMFQPSNIRNSDYKRSYAAHNPGYPSIAGSNLHIVTSARVKKVNFVQRRGNLVATSVTMEDNTIISTSGEIILSAGSFQSPGLLELSGIGNSTLLTANGITPVLDLPGVGENLQDHIRIQSSYQLLDSYTSFDVLRFNATYAADQLALWNANQVSMYDYTGSGYAFMNWAQVTNDTKLQALATKAAAHPLTSSPAEALRNSVLLDYLHNPSKNVPQLEVVFSDGYTGVKGYPAVGNPLRGAEYFSLIAAIQHPFSIGSVHINGSALATPPIINPNYFAQEYDLEAVITAAKYLRKIANTAPLKQAWSVEYEPGLDVVGNGTDATTEAQWKAYALANTLTIYHPVGTCAMLPKSKRGVVDSSLTVYGTSNLRVVDASIIPVLVSAHIQSTVYGIAERAAKMIIDDWN
ncbi:putative glucose-methanol-choline oxidoreductase [Halenospora varia]|nr:putative glucose-methanol-choline oxidoreductase [Halenospora varia]